MHLKFIQATSAHNEKNENAVSDYRSTALLYTHEERAVIVNSYVAK